MSLLGVIAAVFVIGVLVLVHELGHFLVAKYYHVGVLRFAIGFGHAIWKFRKNETTYQIGLIPLGGYVRMVGDLSDVITGDNTDTRGQSLSVEEKGDGENVATKDGEETAEVLTPQEMAVIADKSRWFINKPRYQQAAIIAAGPIANFILAIFVMWFSIWNSGIADGTDEPLIGGVARKLPAGVAGVEIGDRVLRIDGAPIILWTDLLKHVSESKGKPLTFEVRRGSEELSLVIQPSLKKGFEEVDETRKRYEVGLAPKSEIRDAGFIESLWLSLIYNKRVTLECLAGVWGMLSGNISPRELAGPIFIFTQSGAQAERGISNLIGFMALLSISLGVLNLLPIPVLDGGHLFFLLLESFIGPISIRLKERSQQVGALLLLLLMLFAVRNDFTRGPMPKPEDQGWDFGVQRKE